MARTLTFKAERSYAGGPATVKIGHLRFTRQRADAAVSDAREWIEKLATWDAQDMPRVISYTLPGATSSTIALVSFSVSGTQWIYQIDASHHGSFSAGWDTRDAAERACRRHIAQNTNDLRYVVHHDDRIEIARYFEQQRVA